MRLSQKDALRRLQATELEVLKVFASFCEEHDITWWLDSGTALGAMRHAGFIPWDDDIDVGMLRTDYDRFLELSIDKGLFPEGYSVHDSRNTQNFAPTFAKVWKDCTKFYTTETLDAKLCQGIFIDVFPYDKVHKNAVSRKRQIRNARHWQTVSYLCQSGSASAPHKGILGVVEKSAMHTAHAVVSKSISDRQIKTNFSNSLIEGEIEPNDLIITLAWPNFDPLPLSTMVPTTKGFFEHEEFPIPGECESYLQAVYGDWQSLPPLDERKTHLPVLIDFGDGDFYSSKR